MSLTLRLRDVAFLDNGMPVEFVLHRRGAVIGRSPTCDWSLPDARNHVSSRHCEVRFENDAYVLVDLSTNGTFLNGAAERLERPHRIMDGDRLSVGPYEIDARLSGGAAQAAEARVAAGGQGAAAAPGPAWGGWEAHGGAAPPPPPPPSPNGWDRLAEDDGWGAPPAAAPAASPAPPPPPADDGWGSGPAAARGGGWAPEQQAAPAASVSSPWAQPEPARPAASDWSSAAPDRAPAPSPDDIWGRIAEGHVVDWARGGLARDGLDGNAALGLGGSGRAAAPHEAASRDVGAWAAPAPVAVAVAVAPAAPARAEWGEPPAGADWATPPHPGSPPAPGRDDGWARADAPAGRQPTPTPGGTRPAEAMLLDAFLKGAGLPGAALKAGAAETMAQAGQLLRQLIAGMVVMVEARARAKSQMGAEATSFSFDGNNPLKFARTPEQAMEQLLNPKERGFMDAPAAVQDAFDDLQSHQMATLKAMQGALRTTLDRFSPASIRGRAEARGLLTRILPGAREAALWQAYEREYSGVKLGSDEAFMDVFAREFRRAYEEQSQARTPGGGRG